MDREILKGKRILIVDDEPDVLDTVSEVLDTSTVVTVGSFEEAHALIAKESFDLVVLDIMGVNGFALLEACRANKLPAAMLTAHAINVESLNVAVKLGAVSFLPKEELDRLPELVAEILEDLAKGETHWARLFKRLGPFFKERLGVLWEDEDEKKKFPRTFYY
ncbi:MAG: response regulator [Desulfomonile tiedjei]|uniref:Response regulator n=1 Tax=Desulfomonile tiedjei TaxID=2358 RepID=A0A9D6Z6A2_9BACT|nr:response regulator [Desulfomonile tiedjei]